MTLTDGKNNLSKDDMDLIKESNEMSNKIINLLRMDYLKKRIEAIDRLKDQADKLKW